MDQIKSAVLALPQVAAWPEMAGVFDRLGSKPRGDWELPGMACRAVGGDERAAVPGAAAIACLQISIILIDDLLDDDPRGEHLRLGVGPTANLAAAYQAAALRLIEQAPATPEQRAAAQASLAEMALATAYGQHMDVNNQGGEEEYWKVVRAKSTPFYGAALHVGAVLGGASAAAADGLREVGIILGEMIQINDDLLDAFQVPAKPDWKRGRNSLPILYALSVSHPDRVHFVELLERVDEPGVVEEAQRLLIRCGAVSYCIYHLIKRARLARQIASGLALKDAGALLGLITGQLETAVRLFEITGTVLPPELAQEFAQ